MKLFFGISKIFPVALFLALLLSVHSQSVHAAAKDEASELKAIDLAERIKGRVAEAAPGESTVTESTGAPGETGDLGASKAASGADSQDAQKNSPAGMAEPAQEAQKDLPEQATYPGVQNILYRSGEDNEPHAVIWYPAFGNEKVDSDIKYFVAVQGADFEKDVEDGVPAGEEKPATYDQWEMTGFYSLSRPAENIVSVTFNIFSYTGGAHGNLFIRCLNYDLATGKPLELANLFADPEHALKIMSEWCQEKLRAELGGDLDEEMLVGGSSPEEANYMNLSLVKDGVVVEFQPYQVGPWSIGPQSVPVPLEKLLPARPNIKIWPSQSGAEVKTETEKAADGEEKGAPQK